MVLGVILGEVVEHILRQPRWQILRHIATVVRFGTGLATLYLHTRASNGPERVGRHIQTQELSGERRSVQGIRGGVGATCDDFEGPVQLSDSLTLRILASVQTLRPDGWRQS